MVSPSAVNFKNILERTSCEQYKAVFIALDTFKFNFLVKNKSGFDYMSCILRGTHLSKYVLPFFHVQYLQ